MTPELIPADAGALPHRYPFLMLDQVLLLEPGRWAMAVKNLAADDPLLDEEGRLPVVLLAEAMAQTAGLAAGRSGPAVLAQMDRFRCRAGSGAGDRLLVVARVVRRFGSNVKVRTRILVAGRTCAAAELLLHFVPEHVAR